MTKRTSIQHRFVDYIPDKLEDGVLYIAPEFGAVMHLCCDGCGERVSTPLHPAQWKIVFDGETVTLKPSVGSSELPCNSHYIIERDRVRWCRPLTPEQARRDRDRDITAAGEYFAPTPTSVSPAQRSVDDSTNTSRSRAWWRSWWRRLLRRQ